MAEDKNQRVQLRNARPYNWLDDADKQKEKAKKEADEAKKAAPKI